MYLSVVHFHTESAIDLSNWLPTKDETTKTTGKFSKMALPVKIKSTVLKMGFKWLIFDDCRQR